MNVHLISYTNDPIGTALRIWDASRTPNYADVPERGKHPESPIIEYENDYKDEDLALFRNLLALDLPVMRNVVFNFILEDVPITWREQAVRHTIGIQHGDNFGVDIFPDEGTGTAFWSQTMRVMDMSSFAFDGHYWTPESIDVDPTAADIYHDMMSRIEQAYSYLVNDRGIPPEDARHVVPLGATHNISMSINLQSFQKIVGKRGCWISQSNLWMPFIKGAIEELATKIHPVFQELVYPPCVEGGKFVGCKFVEENRRRETGEDAMPLCPLYVTYHTDTPKPYKAFIPLTHEIIDRVPEYAELWDQPDLAKTWEWDEER